MEKTIDLGLIMMAVFLILSIIFLFCWPNRRKKRNYSRIPTEKMLGPINPIKKKRKKKFKLRDLFNVKLRRDFF